MRYHRQRVVRQTLHFDRAEAGTVGHLDVLDDIADRGIFEDKQGVEQRSAALCPLQCRQTQITDIAHRGRFTLQLHALLDHRGRIIDVVHHGHRVDKESDHPLDVR
ncbi:Uncharacterised protein [Mycobacteroides abscessus subsp. massiliense]|nr:Uncharacterised protein [Mycobacteroides abscessus subsp. massiliense]